jgi:hypothetical protein
MLSCRRLGDEILPPTTARSYASYRRRAIRCEILLAQSLSLCLEVVDSSFCGSELLDHHTGNLASRPFQLGGGSGEGGFDAGQVCLGGGTFSGRFGGGVGGLRCRGTVLLGAWSDQVEGFFYLGGCGEDGGA